MEVLNNIIYNFLTGKTHDLNKIKIFFERKNVGFSWIQNIVY